MRSKLNSLKFLITIRKDRIKGHTFQINVKTSIKLIGNFLNISPYFFLWGFRI